MKNWKLCRWMHFSTFIPTILFGSSVGIYRETLTFSPRCRYLCTESSLCNKLIGLCVGFGVHKNSVRFGWIYNRHTDNIDLCAYVYNAGHLTKIWRRSVEFGQPHTYEVVLHADGGYEMYMDDAPFHGGTLQLTRKPRWYTTLGLYFGGRMRCPHDMYVFIG